VPTETASTLFGFYKMYYMDSRLTVADIFPPTARKNLSNPWCGWSSSTA